MKPPRNKNGGSFIAKVLQIIEECGVISRKGIFNEFAPSIKFSSKHKLYGKINEALKTLKSRGKVRQISRGVFAFGGTHGGGQIGGDEDLLETPEESGRRWLSEEERFHNIQGKVEVSDWGSMPGPIFKEKVDLPCGGYLRLLRQGNHLQFWLANKRPAFSKGDLLVAFQQLRASLLEHGVHGISYVQQFEVRNERNEVVHYLKRVRNPFEVKLVEGLIAKAYYDPVKESTNFEFRMYGLEWSDAEFFNCVNAMSSTAQSMAAMQTIGNGVAGAMSRLQRLHELQVDHFGASEQVQQDSMRAMARMTTMMTTLEERQMELSFALQELSDRVDNGIGGGGYPQNQSAFQDPQVADAFQILTQNVVSLGEIVADVKQRSVLMQQQIADVHEEQKVWRDMDTAARLEEVAALREGMHSWQQIADLLQTDKGSLHKWWNRNKDDVEMNSERNDNDDNGEVPPNVESPGGEKIHEPDEQLIFAIVRLLRKTGGLKTGEIRSHVRCSAQKLQDHLSILEYLHVIQNKGGLGRRGYRWELIG